MDVLVKIIKAIILGIVEGITEWLPVSSTGHLILMEDFLNLNMSEDFLSLFEVVIQLGAIIAVVVLFWSKIKPARINKETGRLVFSLSKLKLWSNIIIACVPAAIVGVFFDDEIDALFYHPEVVALALIVVGLMFMVVEKMLERGETVTFSEFDYISPLDAFIIGLFQLVSAIFPGTSRSGATIMGGLVLGLERKLAAEFTFVLAIPVMFGASLLKGVKFFLKGGTVSLGGFLILLFGTLTAWLVSFFVIKFLLYFIQRISFAWFGLYRVVLGIVIIFLKVIDF